MIEQTLGELGLNKKETAVYLEVLKRGKTTPARVSISTGVNRATVYSVAKSLIKKGIVAGDLGGKTLYLTALPPKELSVLTLRDKKALLEKESLIKKAIGELSALPMNTQYAVPTIRFIVEEDLEEYLHKRTETWNKSMAQGNAGCFGFQDHTFVEHFEKWIDDWAKLPSTQGLDVRLFSNTSPVEQKMEQKQYKERQIKFWEKGENFTSTLWVPGEYIVMIYTRERPFYLIEIHNAVMAHNLREVFKNLWDGVVK
jgi:sugar-specific transcriptional regulator TrmB